MRFADAEVEADTTSSKGLTRVTRKMMTSGTWRTFHLGRTEVSELFEIVLVDNPFIHTPD